jgi:phage-related protein
MSRWRVLYYKDGKGNQPAKAFLQDELTEAEQESFDTRLKYVRLKGLQVRDDVMESLKGESNLFSLRLPKSQNNPRFLVCAVSGRRLVLLHGFKEKSSGDYEKAISIARKRRDIVERIAS